MLHISSCAPIDAHTRVHLPYNFSVALSSASASSCYAKVSNVANRVDPFLSISLSVCSLSLSLSLGAYYAGHTHRSAIRGDRLLCHACCCSPAAGYCVPGHTMVPGPVSATHPCPSLLVRARGIVSVSLSLFLFLSGSGSGSGSPLSHLHSGFAGLPRQVLQPINPLCH